MEDGDSRTDFSPLCNHVVITSIEPGQLKNQLTVDSKQLTVSLKKISPFVSADVSQPKNLKSIDVSRNFLDRMTLSSVAHYMHRSWE